MRKKVMAFNAKVNAWIMKRLKGVWLDPIFCAIFAIMCVTSIIGALHLHRDTLYYSALIWAFVMLCPRVFAGIFTPDAELIEFTGRALRIYCAVLAIFGIQQACQITFVSIGKAVCSIIVAVMRKFVLLIPLDTPSDASALARELLETQHGSIVGNDVVYAYGTSIGVSFYPLSGTFDEALHMADTALYSSKRSGKGTFTCLPSHAEWL